MEEEIRKELDQSGWEKYLNPEPQWESIMFLFMKEIDWSHQFLQILPYDSYEIWQIIKSCWTSNNPTGN